MNLSDAVFLVVDDEPQLREIFSAWLARDGRRVFTAANGAEALKIMETDRIDVLVSDIRMPVMDGVELVRNIHTLGLRIPIILFVSSATDIDEQEMRALGVVEMLQKPLLRRDLLDAVERARTHMTAGASMPR